VNVAVFDTKTYDRLSLEAAGEGILWHFHACRLNAQSAPLAGGTDAVCAFVNDRVDRPCLAALAAHGVRLVALRCAGYNQVDLEAARQYGIAIVRVPAYSPDAIAEHTVGLLLALNRRIHEAARRVRENDFSLHGLVGFNLSGKRAGLVGTGKIGRIVARILRGFGMEVIACDPFPLQEWADSLGVTYLCREELLESADVISLHLPLLPQTQHLLNAKAFARLKPGAFIVNTSRGGLIDTTALLAALREGRVGGVALDVYEREAGLFFENLSGTALEDDELTLLLHHPRVLITAHQAFLTREALAEIARVTTRNLLAFHCGEPFQEGTQL